MFSSFQRNIFAYFFRRSFSISSLNHFPRTQQNQSLSLTNSTPTNIVFNDYQIKKTLPKLIDVQKGLNEFLKDSDVKTLTTILETKYRLFDVENISTLIQRLVDLNIRRDSKESFHQRLFDFVDYFVLKQGEQFDFAHVLTMFLQLSSLNGTANLSFALKGLIQLLKHNVNKYHLEDVGRILLTLERDLRCDLENDQRFHSFVDAYYLLTKFRQNELDRLDAEQLAELAFVFAKKFDHVFFTNILTEYLQDEYHHTYQSTMLIIRSLVRRSYRHNRTLDVCLHFIQENKDLFTDEDKKEINECLNKLDYNTLED